MIQSKLASSALAARAQTRKRREHPEVYYKDALFELEAKGEIVVHRVPDEHTIAKNRSGRDKKITLNRM